MVIMPFNHFSQFSLFDSSLFFKSSTLLFKQEINRRNTRDIPLIIFIINKAADSKIVFLNDKGGSV